MEAIGKVNLLSWREQVLEKHCSANSYLECCKSQQAPGWVSCSDPPKQDKGRGRKSTTNPTRLVTRVWSSGPDALPKQILGASYFPENQEQLMKTGKSRENLVSLLVSGAGIYQGCCGGRNCCSWSPVWIHSTSAAAAQ